MPDSQPKDSIPNPFLALRTKLGLTQLDIASEARVGVMIIRNAENGLYLEPPPRVVSALVRVAMQAGSAQEPPTAESLTLLWHQWQSIARKDRSSLLIPQTLPMTFSDYVDQVGPTRYGFCKKLVFDLTTFYNYMDGTYVHPPSLFKALADSLPKPLYEYIAALPLGIDE